MRTRVIVWLGLLGAPVAWAVLHVFGFAITEAACSPGSRSWGIDVDAWTTVAMVCAAAVAVVALACSIVTFRRTRGATEPPDARNHFLAVVGVTVSPLFLFIIVMAGAGVLSLPTCHQS